jgi:hypothetical protein
MTWQPDGRIDEGICEFGDFWLLIANKPAANLILKEQYEDT